jgi:membrane associated rhomboid family serine protease
VDDFIFGAPGAALGMLAAWVVPDLRRARRGEEHDADLLGVLVIAIVIALMPLAVDGASAVATFAGGVMGLLAGLLLARTDAAQ